MVEKYVSCGSFKVDGILIAIDPGQDKSEGIGEVIKNCEKGLWSGIWKIKDFKKPDSKESNERVTTLVAFSRSANPEKLKKAKWNKNKAPNSPFEVAVDQGMAGIFNYRMYPKESDLDDPNSLYNRSLDLTVDRKTKDWKFTAKQGGCLREGVVTNSGWGDGMYSVYIKKIGKKVVAIRIVFIGDDE